MMIKEMIRVGVSTLVLASALYSGAAGLTWKSLNGRRHLHAPAWRQQHGASKCLPASVRSQ